MSHPLPLLAAVIYAKDARRLASFYENVLAIPIAETGTGFVRLGSDGLEFTIVQAPEALVSEIAISCPPVIRENTPIKLSFFVPDIEAVRLGIVRFGGGLKERNAAWSWRGVKHLDGWDPEGNVFQLRQNGG